MTPAENERLSQLHFVRRPMMRDALKANPSQALFEATLTDPAWFIRLDAMKTGNPNLVLTSAQLERALTDDHHEVRQHAVMMGNLTGEQFKRALADSSSEVRAFAARLNWNLTPELLESVLTDSSSSVRAAAVQQHSLSHSQHERALIDHDYGVRVAAVARGSLSKEQAARAVSDVSYSVRVVAREQGAKRTLRGLWLDAIYQFRCRFN